MFSIRYFTICAIAVTLGACATSPRQPRMNEASISQPQLRPGDTAIVSVKVDDRFDIVKRVEGVVAEDGTIFFELHDDGVDPDKVEDDGIWTIAVEVPFNAPPGEFHFTIFGYDDAGNKILILDDMGETAPLSTAFDLQITYPEEE